MILLFWFSLALAEPVSVPDSVQAPASGQVNVDHYFNLGLEMEAQEQRGQAALAYRRGLLLAPHDAQVQERLALLRALPEQSPLLGPKLSGWLGILSIGTAFFVFARGARWHPLRPVRGHIAVKACEGRRSYS